MKGAIGNSGNENWKQKMETENRKSNLKVHVY